jgi:EAL domain-containing protein (putative c-di-GMP-specific phosphodiesterase class I)
MSHLDPSGSASFPPPVNTAPTARDGLTGARLILQEGLYFAEYEPIISLHTGRVVGYEALARFARPDGTLISPGTMFALLHGAPELLLEAELKLKRHQLEHAPRGPELFVNVDPDSWAAGGQGPDNPLISLLAAAPGRLVVEVIENMDSADAELARDLIGALRVQGLHIALDDVGAQNSLLSFEALDEAEVLKFDRMLLRRLGRPRRLSVVRALAQAARETGARSVLEGVESAADLDLARSLGVDLVQGWFFKDLAVQSPRPGAAARTAPRSDPGTTPQAAAHPIRGPASSPVAAPQTPPAPSGGPVGSSR